MKRNTGMAIVAVFALIAVSPTTGAAATLDDEGKTSVTAQAVEAQVQELIDKGDAHAAEGHFGRARGEYGAAAELQREHDMLPARALRRIANSYYYQDRYQSAGKILERLASEAAKYGDLAVQVWALADAAWIAGIAGDKLDVDRRLARLDLLMTSEFLPDEIRQEVTAKRLAGLTSGDRVAASAQ